MATTLSTPDRSSGRPKVNRSTDCTPSAPHIDTRHPPSAAIHPLVLLSPEREPQTSRPNRQKRKVSQSPNFRAMAVMKGWMRKMSTVAAMVPMTEDTTE